MPATKLSFTAKNEHKIHATLELPADEQPKAYAIFMHCLTSEASIGCVIRSLTQKGFAVLQLYQIKEKGKYRVVSTEEVVAAADYLSTQYKPASLLIGHSLAGTTALLAAHAIDSLQALVTIGAPIAPDHIQAPERNNARKKDDPLLISFGEQAYLLPAGWMDTLQNAYKTQTLKKIRKPLLIMHAVADSVVHIDHAADIFQRTLHPKSFVTLDKADHFLSREQDAQYTGNMMAAWVSRYITTYEQSQLTSDKQVVTQTRETFTTQIVADQHTLIADEPESVGGHDLGPDPYDLLAASLGACTGMTLRMYADRKKWPLKEVRVHLQHQKIYAEDCSACSEDKSKNKIDHLERIIEIEGPLDEKQKKRLIEIANKCPVHKTLSAGPKIATTYREKKMNT